MYEKLKKCKTIKEIYDVIPDEFYEKCAFILMILMNGVIILETFTRMVTHKASFFDLVRNYYIVGAMCVVYALIYIGSRICKLSLSDIKEYFKNNIWEVCLTLILLLATISATSAQNKAEAFKGNWYRNNGIRSYMIYMSMYIAGKIVKKNKYKRLILWIVSVTATLQDILIISKYLGKYGSYSGGFYNPNHSAYYITIAIFAMTGLGILEKNMYLKILANILYAFNIMVLIINNTFGCYLAVITGLIFVSILFNVRYRKIPVTIIIYITLFLIVSVAVDRETGNISRNFSITEKDFDNISKGNEEAKNAGTGRIELWMDSIKIIMNKPVLGCGVENIENEPGSISVPHNEFLQIGAENGLIALGLYVIALITLMINKLKHINEESDYTIVFGSIVFAYLASSFFGVMIFYTAIYYFMFLGMLTSEGSRNRKLHN